MKVVICGGGQVGASIAAYLSEEGNNVTVIDQNPNIVADLNESMNVTGIVGHAAHPDVLERAGAADAEMLIAATYSDEVNMVACQVAHSLFNVPMKIARVREQVYLKANWLHMFSRDHMAIDVTISPEVEVARAIANRLRVPGAFNIIPLADGLVKAVSVICKPNCPLIHTPLKHLGSMFPDLKVEILAILRNETKIIPTGNDEMLPGDEVYFVTATQHLHRVMAAFGFDTPDMRHVLIVGAGKIGTKLAQDIQANLPGISVRMVEGNYENAQRVAEMLGNVTVVHGDALDRRILEEAGIMDSEVVVSVMNHDESNVLNAMLAKQYGCERTIALINNNHFMSLVGSLGIDAVVNPRSITVSTILQHVRRGRVKAAHSLRDGFAEILEVEALDTSAIVNTPLHEIKRPKDMLFGLIVRGQEIIMPRADTVIRPDDRVIMLAAHGQVKKVEQMFAVRPEYF